MKKIFAAFAALVISVPSFAGGFITNTNQSVSFLRQPAQNAVISTESAYFNPAGVGFLDKKFHLAFGIQNCTQTRTIDSDYLPLEYGNPSTKKKYTGKTYVPVFPTLDAAWRFDDNFFASAHLGVIGGGGRADFDDGLSSFEGLIAMVPAILNKIAGAKVVTYNMEMDVTAKQYIFSGQLNLGYRINENLAVSAGLRANYVHYTTDAFIGNIQLSGLENFPSLAPYLAQADALFADRKVKCTQTDLGWTPILGINWKVGDFNFAARYEFKTSIRLKNSTDVLTDPSLTQYADGKDDIANDIPAILSLGAAWAIKPTLRANFGFNIYFDKNAKYYNTLTGKNDRGNYIGGNTLEFLAGVEYDIDDRFTLSAGGQRTQFRWGNGYAFISDSSYNVSSYSVGIGVRYKVNDKISLDGAIFKTYYDSTKKKMADYNNIGSRTYALLSNVAGGAITQMIPGGVDALKIEGTDVFDRTNTVLAVGINYTF